MSNFDTHVGIVRTVIGQLRLLVFSLKIVDSEDNINGQLMVSVFHTYYNRSCKIQCGTITNHYAVFFCEAFIHCNLLLQPDLLDHISLYHRYLKQQEKVDKRKCCVRQLHENTVHTYSTRDMQSCLL